ncbi:MAG: RNA polymerase factor sigma-54 [Planctomycetota bacterium]
MKMEIILRQRLEQKLKLAPQIIQSIEILQLPALDLQELITRELQENPVLEVGEPVTDEQPEAEQQQPSDADLERGREEPEFERVDDFEIAIYEGIAPPRRSRRGDDGGYGKMEAMKDTPGRSMSLQEYLLEQFNLLELPEDIRQIGEEIIFNISNDGYVRYSLEEIVESIDMPVLYVMADKALTAIQSLEPLGVGARNLAECLLLQLKENSPATAFKRELIEEHLKDIELNRFPKIAKDAGRTIEEVKDAIEQIRTLHPRPGSLYSAQTVPYVVPDAAVECIDGQYQIKLEDQYIPHLYINDSYKHLLKKNKDNPKIAEFVGKKLDSARWLIDAIRQRRTTLYKIVGKIVEIQTEFLDKGVEHLRPLKMQEVAEAIGVHNSTVSRAISNKYIQTPRGVFPLKYFFTGGTAVTDGTVESRVSVKQRVSDIIDNEDKSNPLSDDDIAKMLKQAGLDVARRTITKYRRMMRIPSSRQRKEY